MARASLCGTVTKCKLASSLLPMFHRAADGAQLVAVELGAGGGGWRTEGSFITIEACHNLRSAISYLYPGANPTETREYY